MKTPTQAGLFAALLSLPAAAVFAADVGVSINVGEPGFYGQINIGSAPPPQVINPRPLLIAPAAVAPEPLYLHVPPGHQRRWSKYCRRYNACDRPVYFVQDRWYNDVYVPHYRGHREEYAGPREEHREDRREERREDRREERHDDRRDHRD